MNTPRQYQFDVSLESITNIISTLAVEGLGEVGGGNLFSHWPTVDQWEKHSRAIASATGDSLPDEEDASINTALTSIETDFNAFLHTLAQAATENVGTEQGLERAGQVYGFLQRIERVQEKIYQPASPLYLTYPYFWRVLSLHLAILKACSLYENAIDESARMVGLLNEASGYISQSVEAAYQQRQREIQQLRGGAFHELAYVYDLRAKASLTVWCDVNKGMEAIDALFPYLLAKAPLEYIHAIPFASGFAILQQLASGFIPAEGQRSLVRKNPPWEVEIQAWTEKAESTWKIAEPHAELLLRFSPLESLATARDLSDKDRYLAETVINLYTSALGSLPIPGASFVAELYGMFLGWLIPQQKDKWQVLEESLKKYVDDAFEQQTLNTIKYNMETIETDYDGLCKRLNEFWQSGQPLHHELSSSIQDLITSINGIQTHIYQPGPMVPKHRTLPYFERYFTLHVAILTSAGKGLQTYTSDQKKAWFRTLYNKTYEYLDAALTLADEERHTQIQRKWGGAANYLDHIVDTANKDTDLTDWWNYLHWSESVLGNRRNYLDGRASYNLPCKLGLSRMFALHDELVMIYNKHTGEHLPTLTPKWEAHKSKFIGILNAYYSNCQKGPKGTGIRFGLYEDPAGTEEHSHICSEPAFFAGRSYTGQSQCLGVGTYNDVTKLGEIQSVRVPKGGWSVELTINSGTVHALTLRLTQNNRDIPSTYQNPDSIVVKLMTYGYDL